MRQLRAKYFDGAKPWEILLGSVLMAAPFLAIIASM